MTGPDTADGGKGASPSGASDRDTLAELDRRIAAARAKDKTASASGRPNASGAALGFAFRIASELAAGVGLGVLVGWQLDHWLGTAPVLLIVFLLVGTVGGIWNVIRTAERMHRLGTGETGEGPSAPEKHEKRG